MNERPHSEGGVSKISGCGAPNVVETTATIPSEIQISTALSFEVGAKDSFMEQARDFPKDHFQAGNQGCC